MAVHLHTAAGAGGYFDVAGANPLHLELVLNDPALRKTNFVMVHGGWPFTREIGAAADEAECVPGFLAAVAADRARDAGGDTSRMAGVRAGESDVRDRRLPVFRRDRLGGIGRDGRACRPESAGDRAHRDGARRRNHARASVGHWREWCCGRTRKSYMGCNSACTETVYAPPEV